MPSGEYISAMDVSASGLAAQRKRMSVIAKNIAHANSLVTPEGGPYRRREITFATVMKQSLDGKADAADKVGGVRVQSVTASKQPFKTVHDPSHPLADARGFVKAPNVNLTKEMVDMVDAQRAYEANLSALRAYRGMMRNALTIIRNR